MILQYLDQRLASHDAIHDACEVLVQLPSPFLGHFLQANDLSPVT